MAMLSLGAPVIGHAAPEEDAAILRGPVDAPSVLIVNSYHPGFTWSDDVVAGVVDTLKERFPRAQAVVEYMDTKRHFDGRNGVFVENFRERLALKYAENEFDLLFASDDNAFRFLLDYGEALFGATPVVFAGVNHLDEIPSVEPRRFTGVVERHDFDRTLDLAISIYPDPPQILVVTDQTTTGRGNRRKIAEHLRARGLQERTIYSAGRPDLTAAALERLVAGVPPGGIIFFADFHVDAHGIPVSYERLLPRLTQAARVPIFTYADFYVGHGPIGGSFVGGYEHGRQGARMAIRILQGARPSTIPIESQTSNHYVFDYKQLKRFGIGWQQLPGPSTFVNEPETLWYEYRLPILGAIALFLFQSLLVAVLIWSGRRRKFMEQELRQSLNENRVLLQEVHHRVKNNLQIISSMIHLARKDEQTDARSFAMETENRIRTLALMHENIYQSESLSAVDLSTYLHELSNSVAESLNVKRSVIDFTSEVAACHVPMDLAIPCGLITNELVTNAVKYGVPADGQAQRIRVHLSGTAERTVRLAVSDNGPGLPNHAAPAEAAGLGLTLVQSLTQQIRGSVDFMNGAGLSCTVEFETWSAPSSSC
jgi:two-component sensor histidine kinase